MRLKKINLYYLAIPFRSFLGYFGHAQAKYTESQNMIMECCLENGITGYGESVPREYVTGESIDSVFKLFETTRHIDFQGDIRSPAELIERLVSGWWKCGAWQENKGTQAAQCALELALLDAYGKFFGMSASDLIRFFKRFEFEDIPLKSLIMHGLPSVSGVIGESGLMKQKLQARAMRFYSLPNIKLKVGVETDKEKILNSVKGVRQVLGGKYGLRIDVNGAWSYEEAACILEALGPLNLIAVEEPLKKEDRHHLRELKQQIPQKIILDESVCTTEDLDWVIKEKNADGINIRISKCGGLIPALEMAYKACRQGLIIQLGAHVGETGILDAAARHFLYIFPNVDFLETSYSGFLLKESLVKEKFSFGPGGKLKGKLAPTGLGIHVDRKVLEDRGAGTTMNIKF